MTSSADRPVSLADIQDWLSRVVAAPGGLAAGLRDAGARHGGGLPVRVPPGVHPRERLAIYARGYLDRLLSVLRGDFPVLRALVGDELFDGFAIDYLDACPPRHASLFRLGEDFADHLERTRPPDDAVAADRRSLLRLPIDLARLERARLEVVRARGVEGVARALDATGLDVLLGHSVRIAATPCLQILELAHELRPFLAAIDRREAPGVPEPRPMSLAVSRRDYRIALTELSAWQREVLRCCHEPITLASVADHAAPAYGDSRGATLAALLLWLPTAEALGLVWVPGPDQR